MGAGVNWQSALTNSISKVRRPSYSVWSTRVAYDVTSNWTAALNVNNLFDKVYYEYPGYVENRNNYGAPRSVTAYSRDGTGQKGARQVWRGWHFGNGKGIHATRNSHTRRRKSLPGLRKRGGEPLRGFPWHRPCFSVVCHTALPRVREPWSPRALAPRQS